MSEVTSLYRHFNAAGELLYVGISIDALYRFKQHNKDGKCWVDDITNMTIERFSNRDKALEMEKAAIISEEPLYNIIYNKKNQKDTIHSQLSIVRSYISSVPENAIIIDENIAKTCELIEDRLVNLNAKIYNKNGKLIRPIQEGIMQNDIAIVSAYGLLDEISRHCGTLYKYNTKGNIIPLNNGLQLSYAQKILTRVKNSTSKIRNYENALTTVN